MVKIYATINYYGDDLKYLKGLKTACDAGIDGIRLNLCKYNVDKAYVILKRIVNLKNEISQKIKLLIDLPYPYNKNRIVDFNFDGKINKNHIYIISTTVSNFGEQHVIYVEQLSLGLYYKNKILIYGDGEGAFEIVECENNYIVVKALEKFSIGKTKSISLELIRYDISKIKELLWVDDSVDFMLSFVHNSKEVKKFREYSTNKGKVIAKIETLDAMQNIEEIVKESDGVLIARGDLGVCDSISLYNNLIEIIKIGLKYDKVLMCATDILLSLNEGVIPNRADIIDISHIISKGCKNIILKDGVPNYEKTIGYIRLIEQQYG